jgi:RimJ/RimL family protein N-acetyltransferase
MTAAKAWGFATVMNGLQHRAEVGIGLLDIGDLPDLYQAIRFNRNQLTELAWVANSTYVKFENHYRQLVGLADLKIFVIRCSGEIAGVFEAESRPGSYFIGFWLIPQFRGQGIITYAGNYIINHYLGADSKLTADTQVSNTKSSNVLSRLGLKEVSRNNQVIYYQN